MRGLSSRSSPRRRRRPDRRVVCRALVDEDRLELEPLPIQPSWWTMLDTLRSCSRACCSSGNATKLALALGEGDPLAEVSGRGHSSESVYGGKCVLDRVIERHRSPRCPRFERAFVPNVRACNGEEPRVIRTGANLDVAVNHLLETPHSAEEPSRSGFVALCGRHGGEPSPAPTQRQPFCPTAAGSRHSRQSRPRHRSSVLRQAQSSRGP